MGSEEYESLRQKVNQANLLRESNTALRQDIVQLRGQVARLEDSLAKSTAQSEPILCLCPFFLFCSSPCPFFLSLFALPVALFSLSLSL